MMYYFGHFCHVSLFVLHLLPSPTSLSLDIAARFSSPLSLSPNVSSRSRRSHPSTSPPCLTSCPPPLLVSDVPHVCLLQTKMSAARTMAVASTSASTQWALMFASVAMALYCMRTNMTVRKVGVTYTGHVHTPRYWGGFKPNNGNFILDF